MFNTIPENERLIIANQLGVQTAIEVIERLCYWIPIVRTLTMPFWASPATAQIFDAVETLCAGLKQFKKEYTS